MQPSPLIANVFEAFSKELAAQPLISLRGGEALDRYQAPPAFDSILDKLTDQYLENYASGLTFLDPISWRYYLPYLIEYVSRLLPRFTEVGEALLWNLRPPDHDPPRLTSLSFVQELAIASFLELLAFAETSPYQEFACQVLEEWWIPGALYRENS